MGSTDAQAEGRRQRRACGCDPHFYQTTEDSIMVTTNTIFRTGMATTLWTVTVVTMSLMVVSVLYAAVLAYPLRSLCFLTP
jgi:hypothetical protein